MPSQELDSYEARAATYADSDSLGLDASAADQAYKTDPGPAHFNGVVLYCGRGEDLQKFIRKLSSKTQVDFMFADAGGDTGNAQGIVGGHDFSRLSMSEREALAALLDKLEKPISHNSSRGGCYIYGYTLPGAVGYIKIGSSVDEQKRLQAWANCCGQTPIKVFKAYMPYAAGLVEKMVHYHLHEFRRQLLCGSKTHNEWFEVPLERSLQALTQVMRFSRSSPLTSDGRLRPFWRKEVREAQNRRHSGEYSIGQWVKRLETALEVEANPQREKECVLAEIRLAVRVKDDGEISRIEVLSQQGMEERQVASVDISGKFLLDGGANS